MKILNASEPGLGSSMTESEVKDFQRLDYLLD